MTRPTSGQRVWQKVPPTKRQVLARLREIQKDPDTESAHWNADVLLTEFINDKDIMEAYVKVKRWYA